MLILVSIILPIFFWLAFIYSFNKDRSKYRNCALLGLAIFSTVYGACFAIGYTAIMVSLLVFAYFLLMVPFMLIANGVIMFRREGHSLANLLSFLLGLAILAGEITTFIYVIVESSSSMQFIDERIGLLDRIFSVTIIYVSVSILLFVIYSLFLMIIPHKRDFDYVIIHGCGLIGGRQVSKLLSDRLDKAIEIYHRDPTPPILIPSGGQGPDEEVSEAAAMADYLLRHDIPMEHIILEDKSMTTFENLRNSKEIIDSQEGRKYTTLVTSNYHVYRALRYCRQINFNCTGVGSHVAPYYWPSAVIREWVAVHKEKKHAIIFAIGWVIVLALELITI